MEEQGPAQDPAEAYKAKAEGMLVKALAKGRADREKNAKLFKAKRPDPSEESKQLPPPPTKYTPHEQERQDVANLSGVPVYDEERQFPGLVQQKIDRKERHMKRCDAFTAYVDELASRIEQDVLEASRSMRDGLEQIDEELQKNYELLKSESYLIPKSEDDLKDWLAELNRIVANRMAVITGLGDDLEKFEVFRAESIEKECRKLTKELISIAHQLPDEIEHIIEGHTYDLNNVLVSNRTSHMDLLALLKKKQVTVDIMTTQYWEDGRVFWRGLRHSKALNDFNEDIRSDRFEKPSDRVLLMQSFQTGQEERYALREEQLRTLNNMNNETITSDDVKKVQEISNDVAEMEEKCIQECYDDLGVLRHDLEKEAQRRVEELRLELHVYGSLHTEPPFKEVAQVLHDALEDEELSELWRLGGGLKPDFISLKRDVCSENLAYEPFLKGISEKFKLICCGFGLKAVLEERGRMMQLEKVRSLGMKIRTVPRAEVDGVLEALLPDLDEICTYEQLDKEFVNSVNEICMEIRAEQERVAEARLQPDPVPTMKTASSSRGTSRGGSAKSTIDTSKFIDSNLVKAWNRRIGVLFYGSDLPVHVQEGCKKGLSFVTEQELCNEKVDIVVLQESKTVLEVMDKKYKRLIDDIAAFLEAQANYMQVCLTNTGNFFLDIAKAVELHRAEQKRLDDKSEDLLYDLKEDFRIEREDREVEFEKACQVMREATSVENLQQDFELVLKVLDDISDSYRTYHSNACFASDKYPLSLADEFKTHLESVACKFNMSPQVTHGILVKYNFIFDETVRLNQRYFLEDPNAGGVAPREKDLKEFMVIKSAEQSLEGSVAGGLDEEGNPILGDENADNAVEGSVQAANEEGSVETKEQDASIAEASAAEEAIVYDSPLVAGGGDGSLYGSFDVETAMDIFVMGLTVDKDDDPASTTTMGSAEGVERGEEAPVVTTTAAPIAHPDCRFVRLGSSLPITKEAQAELDEYDLYDYEKALSHAFIPLSDEDRETLSEEEQAIYDHCVEIVPGIKERIAQEEDPTHLRTNVPVDSQGKPWALKMEIPLSSLSKLVTDIRDSLVTSAEKEAAGRLERADAIRKNNKDKYTNELEDRLRTHWPRRGRVETGIKQPREAELLGHAEKTYRYIQGIHDRMIEVQREVVMTINQADDKIEGYKKEIVKLTEHVSTGTFRNLAMLQGIEVKARGVHLSFQSDAVKRTDRLLRMITAEVDAIVAYAMDFRKVCPPQVPGVEGGYSEAEILEIEEMVKGQCEEANSVQEEWKVERQELMDRQKESLTVHTTFTETFEKVAQNVAMSEGLGQKYGAPRRRAQERIRSEVARDERNAGKIDEMLAKVEFICDEVKLQSAMKDMEEAESSAKDDSVANNGFKEIERSSEVWKLLLNIRVAAQSRVEYLETISIALETPTLDWIVTKIEKITTVETEDTLDHMDYDEGGEIASTKKSTIREVMEEMDDACRAETRTLYESEGMADMLGEGGVPDSLQQWLASSKEKILGPSGHREKAWKRLWAQMERFEKILGRKPAGDGEEEEDEESAGKGVVTAPGVCMRMITAATSQNILYQFNQEQVKFKKLMSVLQEARDKHERLLRPRLGSPDAAAELQELDDREHERSAEYTDNIVKFRSQLIQDLVVTCGKFCEDVGVSSKSLIQYIDTSMRLEAIELPPGTAVPKKRMTLKRLRKAKRIQDAIARGEEDRSIERDWPALDLGGIARLVESVEDLVPELTDEASEQKSLLTTEWVEATQSKSTVHGAVSTAHRILIKERDTAIQNFCAQLADSFFEIRETYGTLLEHEKSWLERWEMQVEMLRSGDL